MWNADEIRRKAYAKRVGKVYGVWKVVKVEYDFERQDQKWTLECVHCGKSKITYNWRELRKGRWGSHCECMNKKPEPKKSPEEIKLERENNYKKHIGEIHNGKEIISYENGKYVLKCIKCGSLTTAPMRTTLEDRNQRCHCVAIENQPKKYNESYIGKKYGHLTVVEVFSKVISGCKRIVFKTKCDCGGERIDRPVHLEKGLILCCGKNCIYKNEKSKTLNGESNTPLYSKWRGMKERCYNPKSIEYSLYGGRGIKICDEWLNNFFEFKEWSLTNGYKEGLTIDRIDPDGNYEPSNCRYITLEENSARARPRYSVRPYLKDNIKHYERHKPLKYQNTFIIIKNEKFNLYDACKKYGLKIWSIVSYAKKGFTFQQAINHAIAKKNFSSLWKSHYYNCDYIEALKLFSKEWDIDLYECGFIQRPSK